MMLEIKASVDEALKKLDEVNKELSEIGEQSKKSGKTMSDSMKSATRSAQLQVEAIKQVVSSLINLGKSSLEAQKEIARLNAAFESSGSSAAQASETYKNIFGFLGDSGAAVEAAQQLAQITPDAAKLKEYETVLQGVYATFGTSIDMGGLSEGINKAIALGVAEDGLADAYEFLGIKIEDVNAKLATFNTESEREAYIRSSLTALYGEAAAIYGLNNASLIAYNQSQASLNIALAEAGNAVLPLMTAFNGLATTLLTTLKPALEVIISALAIVISVVSTAIGWIGSFFSIFSGGSKAADTTKGIAKGITDTSNGFKKLGGGVDGLNKGLDGANKAAKELKKQTMGFDELNVVQDPAAAASGGGGGAGGGVDIPMPDLSGIEEFKIPGLDDFKNNLDEIKGKTEAILVLAGIAGAAFLAWKIASIIQDTEKLTKLLEGLKTKLTTFSGIFLIIAGAVLLVQGYCDAWVNGIDWGNFAAMLGGIVAIIGGVALVAGTMAAGIATIAGGVALLVIGIKDFVTNGYSMQNVLTILAGVIAVVVGVCLAFNAALLANPITWIVIAIAALVAAFVILWNECEGFRNFWIGLWEGIKSLFSAFVDWIAPKIEAVGQFFVKLWEGIKTSLAPLVDAIGNAFKEAWELIKVVWDLVKPYFTALWEGIKLVFSVVKDVLGAFFSAAWEIIKAVWDVVVDYFTLIWENIKAVFSVVKTYFEGMFKTAWEAIKFIWDAVVGYFTAIWNSIAGIFSVVKNVLTGNWQGAWDGIKGIVNTWKDYFAGVWEGIKNVFGAVKNWFSSTFSAAWQAVKNVFSNWGSFFSGLWNTIKNTFSNLGTKLGDAIGGAVKAGINSVISMIEKTINKAIDLINSAISIINKVPGVNIPKLSRLSLPRLAKGGIVDTATIAMIGEAGKEAVVPLENNTEWMDKLADRLAAKSQTPTKVILKVGEKELGWATIGAINGITEQTGGLQLQL